MGRRDGCYYYEREEAEKIGEEHEPLAIFKIKAMGFPKAL